MPYVGGSAASIFLHATCADAAIADVLNAHPIQQLRLIRPLVLIDTAKHCYLLAYSCLGLLHSMASRLSMWKYCEVVEAVCVICVCPSCRLCMADFQEHCGQSHATAHEPKQELQLWVDGPSLQLTSLWTTANLEHCTEPKQKNS